MSYRHGSAYLICIEFGTCYLVYKLLRKILEVSVKDILLKCVFVIFFCVKIALPRKYLSLTEYFQSGVVCGGTGDVCSTAFYRRRGTELQSPCL